jgi:hypothetical protein
MTTRNKTKKALNEFVVTVGTLGLIGAGLGAAWAGNKFIKSGQKKRTGFRYRVGERIKDAFKPIAGINDRISKNIATPWSEAILQSRQQEAHQELADAFGIKVPELHRALQSHARIVGTAPNRDIMRQQHSQAEARKAELTKKLYDLASERTNLVQKRSELSASGVASTHPDMMKIDRNIRLNRHATVAHTLGNSIIDEIDANGNPTGNRINNLNMRINPKDKTSPNIQQVLNRAATPYRDIHGMTVINPETGSHYTHGELITNTKLESLLAANPTATATFAAIKKNILEPVDAAKQEIANSNNTNWQAIRANRAQKIRDDRTRQRAALAMTPPKSVTQPGISTGERVRRAATRLIRNKLVDKLRTSI